MLKVIIFFSFLSLSPIHCWEALPQIPTGRRSQYLVLHENGEYKYGYDSGDGSAGEQSGDASNQVEGRYLYDSPSGQKFDIKYTAGVQGFVPEGIPTVASSIPFQPAVPVLKQYSTGQENYNNDDDQAGTGDASYSFNIDTDSYKRQETSDERGNIKGSYSYSNGAGTHDLTYTAGENTGFIAKSGSLATPNGFKSSQTSPQGYTYNPPTTRGGVNGLTSSTGNPDGSYSFRYSTADASQQQSGDVNGNVKGSYSYRNSAGTHDLSYIAGSDTGFVATGGSLSQVNGLGAQSILRNSQILPNTYSQSDTSSTPVDGSYRFEYSTDDSSRKEVSDPSGNVQGSYSYRNPAGNHDLSYVAGPSTGFQVTGGSLSAPNGLGNNNPNILNPISYNSPVAASPISTYSSQDDLANTGDSSYSFAIDTDTYKRTETSDASGNVRGSFSYKNAGGTQDLSFVAGSATGFQPTGGSLSDPNTISKSLSYSRSSLTLPSSDLNDDNGQSSGDASYNFSIDTDGYKRTETSDANGNVIGSFSYKNSAGQHDLSFEAGAEKGFRATGGSLSIAPGLNDAQLRSGVFKSQVSYGSTPINTYSLDANQILPSTKNTYRIGNVVVNSYLPPSNEKKKFGYIFDTKY